MWVSETVDQWICQLSGRPSVPSWWTALFAWDWEKDSVWWCWSSWCWTWSPSSRASCCTQDPWRLVLSPVAQWGAKCPTKRCSNWRYIPKSLLDIQLFDVSLVGQSVINISEIISINTLTLQIQRPSGLGFQASVAYPLAKGAGFALDMDLAILLLPTLKSLQTAAVLDQKQLEDTNRCTALGSSRSSSKLIFQLSGHARQGWSGQRAVSPEVCSRTMTKSLSVNLSIDFPKICNSQCISLVWELDLSQWIPGLCPRWIPLDDPISFHIAVATLVAVNSFVHVWSPAVCMKSPVLWHLGALDAPSVPSGLFPFCSHGPDCRVARFPVRSSAY